MPCAAVDRPGLALMEILSQRRSDNQTEPKGVSTVLGEVMQSGWDCDDGTFWRSRGKMIGVVMGEPSAQRSGCDGEAQITVVLAVGGET